MALEKDKKILEAQCKDAATWGHEEGEGQVCLPGPVSSGDCRDCSYFNHDLSAIWNDTGMSLVKCFCTPFTIDPFPNIAKKFIMFSITEVYFCEFEVILKYAFQYIVCMNLNIHM